MKLSYTLIVLPIILLLGISSAQNTSSLTLAVFVSGINSTGSFTGGDEQGRPFVEAVKLALELINNDSSLLPDYTLGYSITDAQCGAGASVRGFINQLFLNITMIMIIGADCSTSTEPVAELAPFWNLVQISPLSSSPSLSSNTTYTTFTRVVSSDAAVAVGVVSLMQSYDWARVSVISQQERIFTSTFAQLRTELKNVNISNNPREFTFNTNDDPSSIVMRLYNSPSRIIFLNTYPDYGKEIFCHNKIKITGCTCAPELFSEVMQSCNGETIAVKDAFFISCGLYLAYRLGMTLRNGYTWITFAWYPENWWTMDPVQRSSYTSVKCTQVQLESIVEYAIIIDHYSFVSEAERDNITAANLSRNMFERILLNRLEGVEFKLANQAHFYFDAVWAAASALDASAKQGYDLSLFNYEPNDKLSTNISEAILNNVKSLQFTGMSGDLRFNEMGDRFPYLRYFQYRRNGGSIFRNPTGSGRDNVSIFFPFGVPKDERFVYISLSLFIVYTILACIGIAFAVVCLILNLIFRKRKVVKLSSPYLNVLIVCGIIMFYVDVILFGIDQGTPASKYSVDVLCMLRVWIASIAFSLVFGTIFAKTWRVYYVFYSSRQHKKSKRVLVQNYMLFLIVGVLVSIDVVFLIFVTAFSSSRLSLQDTEIQSNSQDLSTIVGLCRSNKRFIWLSIIFVYKGILLVIGIFLAFETRKVKIRHLNDSKLIGMSVYGIVILSVALAAIGILLESNVDVFYSVVGIMIMLGNSSLLCLIFIPKFYGLWLDPDGLDIMGGETTTTVNQSEASKETICNLNQEIVHLKKELAQLSTSSDKNVFSHNSEDLGGIKTKDKQISFISTTQQHPDWVCEVDNVKMKQDSFPVAT